MSRKRGGDCTEIQEDEEEPDAAGASPSKGEKPVDAEDVPENLKKELYPFTRPVEQGLSCELLQDR